MNDQRLATGPTLGPVEQCREQVSATGMGNERALERRERDERRRECGLTSLCGHSVGRAGRARPEETHRRKKMRQKTVQNGGKLWKTVKNCENGRLWWPCKRCTYRVEY
jgi:hypothetical protein